MSILLRGRMDVLFLRTKASVFGSLAHVLPRREAIALCVFCCGRPGALYLYSFVFSVFFASLFHSLTDSLTH